jgi:hypothetical protein
MTVLMDWALMPDPKPSLLQHHMNSKYPQHPPQADDDEDIFP